MTRVFGAFGFSKGAVMTPRTPRRRQSIPVGQKIRQLRKERGLTQAELAHRIGVQQSDLCRMENGEYKVALDTLFRVLGVFGMAIGEFFRDETPPATPTERETEILRLVRTLDDEGQRDVLDFVSYRALRRSGEAGRS
jgi:transcriptional regulator with XRE-family HTH domain